MKPKQKQYEALRMVAVEGKSFEDAAKRFRYSTQSVRNLKTLVLTKKLDFFSDVPPGPKNFRTAPLIVAKILELRKSGKSIYDIFELLKKVEGELPLSTIANILSRAGISKLERRTNLERGISDRNTLISGRSGILDFSDLKPFKIDCPIAGVFLFLPYILESGIIDIVKECALPESSSIGSMHAALSILLLKLIGNERLSHIQAYDQEPGFGIFAGLDSLPKSTFMSTYSCRTTESMIEVLQKKSVSMFQQKYPSFYSSKYINLDFHSIPHFGEESQMEKVWCGSRGKSIKGANTIFAQDGQSDIILYTKADILRKNETREIKNFVHYWESIKGTLEETLVFDCKLTSYQVLGELDTSPSPVKFITLRKRNRKLLKDVSLLADDQWRKMHLPIPKRKHQKFLIHESEVRLKDCPKPFRQIIIKDHGRMLPTFIITNNQTLDVQQVLEVYAKRWHIENKFSELVSFFNLNALSSPLMVRIHFDIFWTMIADTLYHRLASDLPRFEKVRAPTIFRKFINFPGRVEFNGRSFKVKIRKRAHTPLLLGIKRLSQPIEIPWLNNMPLEIVWTA